MSASTNEPFSLLCIHFSLVSPTFVLRFGFGLHFGNAYTSASAYFRPTLRSLLKLTFLRFSLEGTHPF